MSIQDQMERLRDENRILQKLWSEERDAKNELLRKYTHPCPSCDFSSGQRGMDRCSQCNGTGRVAVADVLRQKIDTLQAELTAAQTGGTL